MNLPFMPSRFLRGQTLNIEPLEQQQASAKVLALSKVLIARQSITPDDRGCQQVLRERLKCMGFVCEDVSRNGVTNTWAVKGTDGPMLVMAGHTDVVPPGPRDLWHSDPFTPTVKDGFLYGRGAADMKTGLAAQVIAVEQFLEKYPQHKGRLAFAITSDEEGDAFDGTWAITDKLKAENLIPDWCLVGEPSSKLTVGDGVRVGRRGSLTGWVTIKGKQGHVAYAADVINPIHAAERFLRKITTKQWDFPSRYFPATSCQVVKFDAFSGANNLTPASADITFNFRYSPKQTAAKLQKYIENKLSSYGLDYDIRWQVDAEPFLSRNNPLLQATKEVLLGINGIKPEVNTAGGTSDGRFFASIGTSVVELGVINKTIHRPNEVVELSELTKLVLMYQKIIEKLLMPST